MLPRDAALPTRPVDTSVQNYTGVNTSSVYTDPKGSFTVFTPDSVPRGAARHRSALQRAGQRIRRECVDVRCRAAAAQLTTSGVNVP